MLGLRSGFEERNAKEAEMQSQGPIPSTYHDRRPGAQLGPSASRLDGYLLPVLLSALIPARCSPGGRGRRMPGFSKAA